MCNPGTSPPAQPPDLGIVCGGILSAVSRTQVASLGHPERLSSRTLPVSDREGFGASLLIARRWSPIIAEGAPQPWTVLLGAPTRRLRRYYSLSLATAKPLSRLSAPGRSRRFPDPRFWQKDESPRVQPEEDRADAFHPRLKTSGAGKMAELVTPADPPDQRMLNLVNNSPSSNQSDRRTPGLTVANRRFSGYRVYSVVSYAGRRTHYETLRGN
jgi:hypothetical protein